MTNIYRRWVTKIGLPLPEPPRGVQNDLDSDNEDEDEQLGWPAHDFEAQNEPPKCMVIPNGSKWVIFAGPKSLNAPWAPPEVR